MKVTSEIKYSLEFNERERNLLIGELNEILASVPNPSSYPMLKSIHDSFTEK